MNRPRCRSLRSTSQIAQDNAEAYGQFVAEVASTLENTVEFPEALLPDLTVEPDDSA